MLREARRGGHPPREAGEGVHGRGAAGPRRGGDRARRGAAAAAGHRARASSSTASRAPSRRPRRSARMLTKLRQEARPRGRARRARGGAGHAHLRAAAPARAARRATTSSPSRRRTRASATAAAACSVQRSDDSEAIIRNRLREYRRQDRCRSLEYFDNATGIRSGASTPTANMDQIFGRIYAAVLLPLAHADGDSTQEPAEIAKLREANLVVADVLERSRRPPSPACRPGT